ncbi:hypothetical protein I302_107626 [Kwoniella bestiolae CBS 10118]|uniref:E3 ubiquitin-protein ligase listerin n=1 Tax=Kwoniella bestiolae CBS 10118 TaxID=1296100 RepID=A0A1B9FY09_9TREE|nr:hypothetical protein I302_06635 [Kwoniella bestiolae CBS 10118]OCF23652.1 hypothetical protein I302_06635 [Kwoniella bestiolae CBS 10118]
MPKPNKSSASAGTRKKNARKAAKGTGEDPDEVQPKSGQRPQRGQKKLSKAQKQALPKVKQFVPPPKPPAPPIPDPLDGLGLARTLPAELVVVLRRLGKKDDVTRRKGLEELREGWANELVQTRDLTEDQEMGLERELKETAVLSAIPVWLHNLASLLQSPFHRSTAIQLHSDLLSIPSLRTVILENLSLSLLPGTQGRDILGSWMVAALEEGRRAGGAGLKSWDNSVTWSSPAPKEGEEGETSSSDSEKIILSQHLGDLVEYLTLSILDPATLHDNIHPAPVSSVPPTSSPAPNKKGQNTKGGGKGKATPAPTPKQQVSAPTPSAEDGEMAEERLARYRVGGLVGLNYLLQQLSRSSIKDLPQDLVNLIRNPGLWLALSPEIIDNSDPDSDSPGGLGTSQPPIRRAAYSLLSTLVDSYPEQLEEKDTLRMLSDSVLGHCWLEKEGIVWETAGMAVAKFIRKWPECWTITADSQSRRGSAQEKTSDNGDEDDEEDDDDDESDEEEESKDDNDEDQEASTQRAQITASTYYANFLEFISTICPYIPHLTYPLLLVVISTLPTDLLPLTPAPTQQIQNLFSHIWAPVDSRLLSTHSLPGQQSAFQVFLQSMLDCTGYLISKSWSAEESKETASWLVKTQLGERVWTEGVLEFGGRGGGRRAQKGASQEVEANAFGKSLGRLTTIDQGLATELAKSVRQSLLDACFPETPSSSILPRSVSILSALKNSTDSELVVQTAEQTIRDLVQQCVEGLPKSIAGEGISAVAVVETIVEIFKQYSQLVRANTTDSLLQVVQTQSIPLSSAISSDQLVSLLDAIHSNASNNQESVQQILSSLLQSTEIDSAKRFALAQSLLTTPPSGLLRPGSLDPIATESTQVALASSSPESTDVAISCLKSTQHLSNDALDEVLALVCTAIHGSTEKLLTGHDFSEETLPVSAFKIFATYATDHLEEVIQSEICIQSLISVHHVIFLLPRVPGHIASSFGKDESLTQLWNKVGQVNDEEKKVVLTKVHEALREGIQRVEVEVDPTIFIDVALATALGDTKAPSVIELSQTLLPPINTLVEEISTHATQPLHPSLPIIDPLVPYSSEQTPDISLESDFDLIGRSKAARWAEAVVALLRADRQLVASQPALLQVALAAYQLTQDTLAIPGSSRGLYAQSASIVHLTDLIREVEGAVSYALSFVDEAPLSWHNDTVQILKSGSLPETSDLLQMLLSALKNDISATGGDVSARSFRNVLSRHLRQSGAGEKEAEVWLNYAMTLIDKAPQLALAITYAIKPLLLDHKSFALAQNRLANALTSVKAIPSAVSKQGIPYLRLLIASAPPADAASVFLPQQRAIFVLRHVNSWLTADDDEGEMPEEVEYRIAELETALAPIVQDLSGGHWDAIFDLVESGLNGASLDDVTTSCLTFQSLLLLQQIRDLCQTNKSLRAEWTAKDDHMKAALNLFLQCRTADSTPLLMVQTVLLDLLGDIPENVMENASLGQLADLIHLSTSSAVQCASYRILSKVIKHNTIALVLEVEASVAEAEEGHQHRTIELPKELVEIVGEGQKIDWMGEVEIYTVLGQLLAWLAILDHFEDASRTLRWAYLDQLNSSKLLTDGLLPMLFAMLGVSEMGAWNFPASQYAVDEFYPELLDPEGLADLTPLASYLFYRALVTIPSALRGYYESIKSRQLSMSMLTFVARHYSPVIIAHEFEALREPSALKQLTEEGLNIRIAQGGGATSAASAGSGSSEAIASYVVDEQPMEIGIRLPAEFPLRGVDVRDLRRVGVPENKWRGWLMSTQQTITSRNGLILEALTIFKKNVSLHFEGVVECAICYSIISLTDRTLPTKPCRTCKNRFHASCLFKWFNSSHSSSCPLCRSLF